MKKETPFAWTCPTCDKATTISSNDFYSSLGDFYRKSSEGEFYIRYEIIVCPNPKCKKPNISITLYKGTGTDTPRHHKTWQLIPSSKAKQLHADIPPAVKEDYSEASEILDRSPKAAATLARRAIQGMIRHFFEIEGEKVDKKTGKKFPKRLSEEIKEIQPRVDPIVWQAIEAVRKVGSIGAHMEEDVNLIIDVKPEEAEALLSLIEFLSKEWYGKRAAQIEGVLEVAKIVKNKELQRKLAKSKG